MRKTGMLSFAVVFLLLLGMGFNANAQYVYVGDVNSTTRSSYVPFYNFYRHNITQTIYLASEMGGATNIHAISFKHHTYDETTDSSLRVVKVYIAHTTKSSFSSASDWETSVGNSVYYGQLLTPNTANDEWVTIQLDQSFPYNGTDNIVVTVVDDAVNNYAGNHSYFVSSTSSARCIYAYNDNTAYSVNNFGNIADISSTNNSTTNRPVTRFFTAGLPLLSFIQVGDDNNTTYSSSIPIRGFFKNSVSQQIFLNNEVGGNGTTIYGIQFYQNPGSGNNDLYRKIRLYTDNTSYAHTASSSWISVNNSNLAFEGTYTLHGEGEEGWYTIWFDQPYTAANNRNLVISIDAQGEEWQSGHTFLCHSTQDSMAISIGSDSQTFDATNMSNVSGVASKLRNSVRFITAVPTEPLYVTLTAPSTAQSGQDVQLHADFPNDAEYDWYAEDYGSFYSSPHYPKVMWKLGGTYKVRITVSRGGEVAADSAMITVSPFVPQTEFSSNAQWYGDAVYCSNIAWDRKFLKFNMHHPEQAQVVYNPSMYNVFAAEYVDGYVYFYDKDNKKIYKVSFSDFIAGHSNHVLVGDCSDYTLKDMSYNYVDNTLYAISGDERLLGIDLATGQCNVKGTLTDTIQTIAINNQGEAYGIGYKDGIFHRIDLSNGSMTEVGTTGKHPVFVQSMSFDRNTGELFWAYYENGIDNGLCKVNTTTGQAYYIGYLTNKEIEMTGLFMVPGQDGIPTADNVDVNVYPNPTENKVVVEAEGLMYIVVLDLNGRAVMTSYNGTVDLVDQPSGAYLLRVVTKTGTTVHRVVKK